MFTCPKCNADRSRVLPIDPCPACGAMLTPDRPAVKKEQNLAEDELPTLVSEPEILAKREEALVASETSEEKIVRTPSSLGLPMQVIPSIVKTRNLSSRSGACPPSSARAETTDSAVPEADVELATEVDMAPMKGAAGERERKVTARQVKATSQSQSRKPSGPRPNKTKMGMPPITGRPSQPLDITPPLEAVRCLSDEKHQSPSSPFETKKNASADLADLPKTEADHEGRNSSHRQPPNPKARDLEMDDMPEVFTRTIADARAIASQPADALAKTPGAKAKKTSKSPIPKASSIPQKPIPEATAPKAATPRPATQSATVSTNHALPKILIDQSPGTATQVPAPATPMPPPRPMSAPPMMDIGPPPESNESSYPADVISGLGLDSPGPGSPRARAETEDGSHPVWRQAHPSAQRWAKKRGGAAVRTPHPTMIALGLILSSFGAYFVVIFLPSKAPLSAAAHALFAQQAGVDETAWRLSKQLFTGANLNAGLFILLGIVLILRGALHRQQPGQTHHKKLDKTSVMLIFCFALLSLSFIAILLKASLS